MAQTDADGYMLYPGLTAFPVTLGHEFAGVMVEAGPNALDRRTNKPFAGGDAVCAEEMFWCGQCRPRVPTVSPTTVRRSRRSGSPATARSRPTSN